MNAPQQPAAPGAVRLQLLDVLGGFLYTQAIATVARLGVADIVGEEPVPVEELAARVGADPSALHRVMRLLAAVGIFSQAAPGAFVGTQLSDGLRDDRPDSVRYLAMQQGSPAYLAASEMLRCVRTGEPAAETVFGMPFFEYLATDAEASDVFNRAMAGGAAARASVALEYDWSGASVVADIGGGTGSLLSSVLGAQPHLRGVVFDLPHVAVEARPVIEAAGLSDRCETAGGDFFTEALPSADVYVLAQILHDWDDERAVAILRNCRRSIAEGGRVLVVEQVLPEGNEPSYGKLIDLIMLTLLGGKERTEAEWRTLLREGGFELVGVTTGPAASLLEAAPA
ncbi:MAG: acetylserotonin O-methyltransferase [Actinomycetota bacterium]|nr:acetylserotonin O-methyltransferase [Actinomycetota bacterium]